MIHVLGKLTLSWKLLKWNVCVVLLSPVIVVISALCFFCFELGDSVSSKAGVNELHDSLSWYQRSFAAVGDEVKKKTKKLYEICFPS